MKGRMKTYSRTFGTVEGLGELREVSKGSLKKRRDEVCLATTEQSGWGRDERSHLDPELVGTVRVGSDASYGLSGTG